MTRRKQSEDDGFNLAFLDVMACGLGAVILIFMLVDFSDFSIDTSSERSRLEAELSVLDEQRKTLESLLEQLNTRIEEQAAKQAQNTLASQRARDSQSSSDAAISRLEQQRTSLSAQLAQLNEQLSKQSQIEKVSTGEQNYIVGLPVDGNHIGILIDKSTSMMEVELADIILATTLTDEEKKLTPKWVRTKNIVNWLLARIPNSSSVTVMSYSETPELLGDKAIEKASNTKHLQSVLADLGKLVPNGGTNLKNGLDRIMMRNPSIDTLYIITDGLPTLGASLNVSGCRTLLARKTISADCRRAMGEVTFEEFVKRHPRVKLNTILLPLEGDPLSSSVYWTATWATGGKMLSPAREWQ